METFSVLLVDDEADFRQTLAKRLARRQLQVTTAADGAAALAHIAESDVDVVLLDVKMPGLDGIEVLREIKKLRPLVEVIMLTGHASVEVAIAGMGMGAFDYLMKPMDIDEIVFKLQDAHKNKVLQEEKIRNAEKHLK
jgi:DNA-binding NtrC family response regulator